MRCAAPQSQATIAAILKNQFRFAAAAGIKTHAGGIVFSAVMSLRCSLAKIVFAKLRLRILETAIFLFELCHSKRLLPMAMDQYVRQATNEAVLFADEERSAMTS